MPPDPRPLWSAEAKFRNGSEHLVPLRSEVVGWLEDEAGTVSSEKNADATEHSLVMTLRTIPPLIHWSLMVGDVLHNLRASLDHAVYALAVARHGSSPPPYAGELAFPIADTDDKFDEAIARHRLGDLGDDDAIRTAIQGLQPYRRTEPPDLSLLTILRELENRDKDKLVPIIGGAMNKGEIEPFLPPMDPWPAIRTRIWTHGPIQKRTEVFALVFDRPAPDVEIRNAGIDYYVALEIPGVIGPTDMVRLLEMIRDEVRYCLDAMAGLV